MRNIIVSLVLLNHIISFGQSPVPNFTHDIRKVNCDLYLADFYYSGDADSCCWDFGEGVAKCPSYKKTARHTYSKPGTFSVKLTLWKDGMESNIIKNDLVRVVAPPIPNFEYSISDTNGYAPLNIEFRNTTELGDCKDVNYNWDFGDWDFTQDENPNHDYRISKTYYVTLNVTDTLGCDKNYSDYIIVKDTAQRGEFEFITSNCLNEYETPPCGYDKQFKLINDSLFIYGYYYGNCGTYKTATIRYSDDTIKIKTWEVGPETTCSCGYCFEIVIPNIIRDSVNVVFNGANILSALTSISKQNIDNPVVKIFPNPVEDYLTLLINEVETQIYDYKIYDSEGRIIQTGKLNSGSQIGLKNTESGVYIICISDRDKNKEFVTRFIKK